MQIGSVGVPYHSGLAGDFETVFRQMAAAGQTLFMPMSVYEEVPVVKSIGWESAFFPPPWGSAGPEIYEAMRAYGIKMIVPASLIYPLGTPLPATPEDDPLLALIDAAGRDLIAAVYTYDEPVHQGVPLGALQAVYQHVKATVPDMPVMQVNAPVQAGQDLGAYLAAVTAAAEWTDQLGFSVYSTNAVGAGPVTPYSGGAVADPVIAVADYARWIEETLPDKLRIGVLQGFGVADLYSDEALAELDPAVVAAAQAPDIVTMSGLARALDGVDTLIWFGASYLENVEDTAWQDVLDVSASLDTHWRDAIGPLDDANPAANTLSETSAAGARTGIVLALGEDADETPTYAVDDGRFAVRADGTVVFKEARSLDFETEPVITLIGSARLTDGRIATQSFVLTVTDAAEWVFGTAAGEELVGAAGRDMIHGFGGDDWLWGLGGDDWLDGGSGADVLLGEAGRDTLSGDAGDDLLLGGTGDDRLTGGSGADLFVFRENEGSDGVTDFSSGVDKVVLVGTASHGVTQSGDSARILYGGTEIVLDGVDPAQLSWADFILLESL